MWPGCEARVCAEHRDEWTVAKLKRQRHCFNVWHVMCQGEGGLSVISCIISNNVGLRWIRLRHAGACSNVNKFNLRWSVWMFSPYVAVSQPFTLFLVLPNYELMKRYVCLHIISWLWVWFHIWGKMLASHIEKTGSTWTCASNCCWAPTRPSSVFANGGYRILVLWLALSVWAKVLVSGLNGHLPGC